MAVHDDRIAMDPIIVVSRISSVLRPSTPRKYSAPTDGIHGARSTNWKSALCGLYQNHSGTEMTKPMNATMFAIQRMAFSFCLLTSSSSERAGERREQNDRKVVASYSPHEQINADEREDAEQHQQRVVLHETGLQRAGTRSSPPRTIRPTRFTSAVDDRAIGQAREPGADDRDPAGAVDRAVDDVAIERSTGRGRPRTCRR